MDFIDTIEAIRRSKAPSKICKTWGNAVPCLNTLPKPTAQLRDKQELRMRCCKTQING